MGKHKPNPTRAMRTLHQSSVISERQAERIRSGVWETPPEDRPAVAPAAVSRWEARRRLADRAASRELESFLNPYGD